MHLALEDDQSLGNSGLRFCMKDAIAYIVSFVWSIMLFVRAMLSSPSYIYFDSACLITCFIVYTPTGLFEAINRAVSKRPASSWLLSSKILETKPIFKA